MTASRAEQLLLHTCNKQCRLLVAVMCCLLTLNASAVDRPNIVVFLVDDMGVMDTSVPFLTDEAGTPVEHELNHWYRTPGMQRLADQGVRFNNFCAMSVCSPTRTSVLTGQNVARHHVTQWIRSEANNRGRFGPPGWNWPGLKEGDVTLPAVLRGAGYRTLFVGKAHFGPFDAYAEDPANLGFDVNIAGCSYGQPGSYYGPAGYGWLDGNKSRAVPGLEKYHGTDTFLTEALTIEAMDQVDRAVQEGKPFFLYLAHYAVHAPFDSDPRFADRYAGSGKPKNAQAFATLIEGMDKSLSDVLDHLEALGVAEDTLVLFLGDNGSDGPLGDVHGYSSSAPLRGKKGTHYEGGTRVPFIAAWARPDNTNRWQQELPIARGAVQPQLGTVMDLFPTVLALAGVDNPEGHAIDGYDLSQQFAGGHNPDRPERFLMHFPHEHRSSYFTSLRDGGWKLIYHYRPDANPAETRYELFNLEDDPYETTNLAEREPDTLRRMMRVMIDELERAGAQYPVDENGDAVRPVMP